MECACTEESVEGGGTAITSLCLGHRIAQTANLLADQEDYERAARDELTLVRNNLGPHYYGRTGTEGHCVEVLVRKLADRDSVIQNAPKSKADLLKAMEDPQFAAAYQCERELAALQDKLTDATEQWNLWTGKYRESETVVASVRAELQINVDVGLALGKKLDTANEQLAEKDKIIRDHEAFRVKCNELFSPERQNGGRGSW